MNVITKFLNLFRKKTPDISNQVQKRKSGVLDGLAAKNWDKVIGNLYVLNSLLPRKYRIKLSLRERQQLGDGLFNPPPINNGYDYERKMKVWAENFMYEIDGAITNYRNEYKE